MRVGRMAMGGNSLSNGPASSISGRIRRPRGALRAREPGDIALACGQTGSQAIACSRPSIHEFAERPAEPRADEIRHRPAGAAHRRPDPGARRRPLHRRRQAPGRGLCGDGAQPARPRRDQGHRHRGGARHAGRARRLYRRRPRRLRHAQMHRAVQQPRRLADEEAAAAGAADRQGALRRRPGRLRGGARRRCRPRTPPRRSRSRSSRCPP